MRRKDLSINTLSEPLAAGRQGIRTERSGLAGQSRKRDTAAIAGGVQVVLSVLSPRSYPDLKVKAGVCVRWVITAEEASLNSCNSVVSIPAFNIYQVLAPGENIIEFLPEKPGVITYSCWMGMISATITVTSAPP